jgi:hypothetical protein
MVENERVDGEPAEEPWGVPKGNRDLSRSEGINWSKVSRPEPMDVPDDFDFKSNLANKEQAEIVRSWIENFDIKKIVELGSGKVYTRDAEGIFTIITEIEDEHFSHSGNCQGKGGECGCGGEDK